MPAAGDGIHCPEANRWPAAEPAHCDPCGAWCCWARVLLEGHVDCHAGRLRPTHIAVMQTVTVPVHQCRMQQHGTRRSLPSCWLPCLRMQQGAPTTRQSRDQSHQSVHSGACAKARFPPARESCPARFACAQQCPWPPDAAPWWAGLAPGHGSWTAHRSAHSMC